MVLQLIIKVRAILLNFNLRKLIALKVFTQRVQRSHKKFRKYMMRLKNRHRSDFGNISYGLVIVLNRRTQSKEIDRLRQINWISTCEIAFMFFEYSGRRLLKIMKLWMMVIRFIFLIVDLLEKFENRFTIKRPPGMLLLQAAEFLYSKEIYENVFQSVVADWRCEYYESLTKKQFYKCRWINLTNIYRFFANVVRQSPAGELFELVLKFGK